MEGPSLFLAQQQLRPFKGAKVLGAGGNTKAFDPKSLKGLVLRDVFAWGKHLVFQFDAFGLRFHFLMFGTFEAQVGGVWITGDYRRSREPRLWLDFSNGRFNAYSCSVRMIDSARVKIDYDFGIDIMSPRWDERRVRALLRTRGEEQVADALLDQDVFAGVGNIIKNEVLSNVRVSPMRRVSALSPAKLRELVAEARTFSKQFYRWRKKFELRKNLHTHRKHLCQHCGEPLLRAKTGKKERWSYWCDRDQK